MDYVEYFDPRIVGLMGSLDGGDYTMEHSANVQLADADGFFFGTLDGEEPFETRLAKLRRLID